MQCRIATISMALGKSFHPSFLNFFIYEMSGSQTFRLHGSGTFLNGVNMKQQSVANIILQSMDIKNNKIKNYHLLVPLHHKIKDITKVKIVTKNFKWINPFLWNAHLSLLFSFHWRLVKISGTGREARIWQPLNYTSGFLSLMTF